MKVELRQLLECIVGYAVEVDPELLQKGIIVDIHTPENQPIIITSITSQRCREIFNQNGKADEPFVPNQFQDAILDALEGKALRTDALAAKVGDRARLFRPGGLKDLQAAGLVSHHNRLGFYRPDAPPEELAGI